MSSSDKPTPSVPPTDQTLVDAGDGTRILSRERVDTCDCGGTVYDVEETTGKRVVATWDFEDFDADEYRLHTEWEQTRRYVECDRCGAGWSF